ncbi:MAG: hypothetical protein ACTS4U_01265 [Candidatus Hodgkinia cicadicola]
MQLSNFKFVNISIYILALLSKVRFNDCKGGNFISNDVNSTISNVLQRRKPHSALIVSLTLDQN